MRVIPIRAGAVGDLELVEVIAAGGDRQAGMSVSCLGNVEPVPVDDGLLGQPVVEVDADLLSAPQADHRSEIRVRQRLQRGRGPLDQLPGEPPDAGGRAGENLGFPRRRRQRELDIGLKPRRAALLG